MCQYANNVLFDTLPERVIKIFSIADVHIADFQFPSFDYGTRSRGSWKQSTEAYIRIPARPKLDDTIRSKRTWGMGIVSAR